MVLANGTAANRVVDLTDHAELTALVLENRPLCELVEALYERFELPLGEFTDLTPAEIREVSALKLALVGLAAGRWRHQPSTQLAEDCFPDVRLFVNGVVGRDDSPGPVAAPTFLKSS